MIQNNSFFIETYGCTFNKADSNKMAQSLIEFGLIPSSLKHSEFIIINTCAVKSQTQDKILSRIKRINLENGQKLIIAGCLPWISEKILEKITKSNKNIIGLLHTNSIDKITDIVSNYLNKGNLKILKEENNFDKTSLKPWIPNVSEPGVIQICEGCTKNCTFCCTKISRGKLISFNPDNIILEIEHYLNKGVKEIFLTAQDCGLYKYDNYDLAGLLELIYNSFSNRNNFFIRVGMLDPNYLIKNVDRIIKILDKEMFYNFLHIPIQSASTKVLKKMKRDYNNKHIEMIFSKLRLDSNITISTDIICGFPNESDQNFNETLEFIRKYQPEIINISKFTPRPNTEALSYKQLNSKIVKARTEELTQLYHNYSSKNLKDWLDWEGDILLNKYAPDKKYQYSGRNQFYRPIVLKNDGNFCLNNFVKLKITDFTSNYLIGSII